MGQDADTAVAALYRLHYRFLVGLAVLLVRDIAAAEGLVQDSFVAMHSAWRRLEDSDRALSYLHQAVVSRSRSVLRHRMAGDKIRPGLAAAGSAVASVTPTELERSALVSALWSLAPRQREVLVLLYYADLSEAQIASVTESAKARSKATPHRRCPCCAPNCGGPAYAELRRAG